LTSQYPYFFPGQELLSLRKLQSLSHYLTNSFPVNLF
jgi:hypothetical protein